MSSRLCPNGHVTDDDHIALCPQCGESLPPVPATTSAGEPELMALLAEGKRATRIEEWQERRSFAWLVFWLVLLPFIAGSVIKYGIGGNSEAVQVFRAAAICTVACGCAARVAFREEIAKTADRQMEPTGFGLQVALVGATIGPLVLLVGIYAVAPAAIYLVITLIAAVMAERQT